MKKYKILTGSVIILVIAKFFLLLFLISFCPYAAD